MQGNTLARFEFWELLVRIANNKYRESGQVQTYSQALEKLITEKLLVYETVPWQGFRDKELWVIDVHDILDANLENLNKIYKTYFTSVKKYVVFEDIIALFTRDCPLNISESDLLFCFGMCKMAVTNEPSQFKQYQVMLFPEFLEFIGRASDIKFKGAPDLASNPLAWKIDQLLDEIMPSFGLTKNDVMIKQEDFSESDDDY